MGEGRERRRDRDRQREERDRQTETHVLISSRRVALGLADSTHLRRTYTCHPRSPRLTVKKVIVAGQEILCTKEGRKGAPGQANSSRLSKAPHCRLSCPWHGCCVLPSLVEAVPSILEEHAHICHLPLLKSPF